MLRIVTSASPFWYEALRHGPPVWRVQLQGAAREIIDCTIRMMVRRMAGGLAAGTRLVSKLQTGLDLRQGERAKRLKVRR
jgi:hypothetical protein